ncbi:hypothetical protein [Dehalobacterium formicoaceticum]|uniref:Uncharacterized protein n=1 Tax=Dehalobacterium formicoaceticum TaxID=51515 RepID=A0ABT1Y1B2_9FIRM|nr:hypothetical protein [Dehalobacterium formicoaceticum]MCR6544654.1 hypothetical protein [Dehalobacterium formicoaceticum]
MWPLTEVHTTAAVWTGFFTLWAMVILGPIVIAGIINKVWWKGHFNLKVAEIEQEIQAKKKSDKIVSNGQGKGKIKGKHTNQTM